MTAPRVSIAIVALNEAENLRELLPQLNWGAEIVVVDGGSTDDTVATARRSGAKVINRRFDDFASQRNIAHDASRGDWVFHIDADERPSRQFVAELQRRIAAEGCAAYRVPIRSCIFNRPFRFSGTQDDRPIRLIRRGAGHWTGRVHETPTICGTVGRLEHALEHHTLPTVSAFLAKMERYTTLAAAERMGRGAPPQFGEPWWRPLREAFRRLVWKHGWLDGPEGWKFCLLSGYSEWVFVQKCRRLQRRSIPILLGDAA